MTESPPAAGETFALATLRDMISSLQDHIDHRAAEIAAPRITAAEQQANEAEDRAVEADKRAEKAWQDRAQRDDDLSAELRRQLASLERQHDRLWWLSQYLPKSLRYLAPQVLPGLAERLPEDWRAMVARRVAPGYDPHAESELLMLIEAIELVVRSGSAAQFQRKMRVGFATAGKLLDRMTDLGVLGREEAGGRRPREVLMKPDALPGLLAELRAPREVADQSGEAS